MQGAPSFILRIPGLGWGWGLLIFPALTLVVALASAPNSYDGMAYHMARVVFWVQEKGLIPFATHDPRQLYFAPLSEVLQLHLYLLAGSDRLVALSQWLAYLVSGVLVFAAAERLGGRRAAGLALIALWSAPMTIAQASSTQNDLLCAAFCLMALSLLWRAAREGGFLSSSLGGLAAGLACLVKPTAYIFMAPWILAILWLGLRQKIKVVLPLGAALILFASIQAPFWIQNIKLGSRPIGPDPGTSLEGHAPGLITASLVKQAALHIPGFPGLREMASKKIDLGLRMAGQNPVDPRGSSYWNAPEFGMPPEGANESTAANWAQVLLGLMLALVFFKLSRAAQTTWLLAVASGLLYCALVKWQPWATRLHTPGFVMASLGLGLGLAGFSGRIQVGAALLFLISAMPALLHLEDRPLFSSRSVLSVPRWQQYFRGRDLLKPRVEAILSQAAKMPCASIALDGGGDHPEYLLWEGLRLQGRPFELRSLKVSNASAAFERKDFKPCLRLDIEWKDR